MEKFNLELIEAFKDFSLYYDRTEKKLWIYKGGVYYGTDMKNLLEWLRE